MTTETVIDFNSNLNLVHHVCKRFKSNLDTINKINGFTYDDLFQIGCIALLKAIDNFDETLGYTFATYAIPKIKWDICHAIRDNRMIKSPREDRELITKLYIKHGESWYDIDVNLLAESISTTIEHINELILLNTGVSSLNEIIYYTKPTGQSQGEEALHLVPSNNNIDDDVEYRILLGRIMDLLKDREKQVFTLYFLNDFSQQEIAKIINTSQTFVSTTIKKIKSKLHTLQEVA